MGEWEKIPIGKLCKITKGRQLNKIDLLKSGDYPCLNGGIEPSGYTAEWNTEANTITISEGGNSCGYINFMRTRFWSGGHCYSLLDIIDDINRSFFYQALKGNEKSIMALRVGSGLPNIQRKALASFEITYPTSKLEQSKISEILSTVDKAIEQTVQLIEKYKRIKTGLMQDLLTKGIDERGNIRSEQTHKFKDSPLDRIPVEWEVSELWKCSNIEISGVDKKSVKNEIPVKLCNYMDVYTNEIITRKIDFMVATATNEEVGRFSLKIDDVLITKDSETPDDIAVSAVVIEHLGNILCGYHLALIRPNRDKLIGKFLNYLFGHYYYKIYFGSYANGSTRFGLSLASIKLCPVLLPSPDEQKQIIVIIESISKIILENEVLLNKYHKLKSGLMQALLTGKVKVPEELINEINKLNIN